MGVVCMREWLLLLLWWWWCLVAVLVTSSCCSETAVVFLGVVRSSNLDKAVGG